MSSARLGRGTKSKVFLYIFCGVVLGTVIYVFHGTQSQLEDVKKAASICTQQQESLSAQLQVIFEYKLRLEKSLQKEKADHRQTKEKLLAQLDEEKQSNHRDNLENSNKVNILQEKYDLLQSEHKALNDEFTELKNKQNENNEAQKVLRKQAEELKTQLELIKSEKDQLIEKLKSENFALNEQLTKNLITNDDDLFLKSKNTELENKVKDLENQVQSCTKFTKLEDNAANEVQDNVPNGNNDNLMGEIKKVSESLLSNKVPKAVNSSTTPFINPQAVIDHDNNHDAGGMPLVSSAKPLVYPPKEVIANLDDNAADEEKDKANIEDQDNRVLPNIPEEDAGNENPKISGGDVIAPPPLTNN